MRRRCGGCGLVIHPAWRRLGKYSRYDSDTDTIVDDRPYLLGDTRPEDY